MDILELKSRLLEQHKIDKKRTLYKDMVIILFVVIVIVFASYVFSQWLYYFIGIGAVFVIPYAIYAIMEFKRLDGRDKHIERFVDKIKSGDTTLDIREYRRDKIVLPFLKNGFFPTDYISVAFQTNPSMYYTFPVDLSFIYSMEKMLDEAKEKYVLTAKRDFLDANLVLHVAEQPMPLKNVDEFKQFLYQDLKFSKYDLEGEKPISKSMFVIASGILLIVAAGFFYYMYLLFFDNANDLLSSPYDMLIVIAILVVVFYATYSLYLKPHTEQRLIFGEEKHRDMDKVTSDFKNKIMNQVVKFINPQAQYMMNGYLDKELVLKSGLFKDKDYTMSGDDLIIGHYNGLRFQFSDLKITHESMFSKESGTPDVVFRGPFFMARLHKSFSAPVYIVYRKSLNIPHDLRGISGVEIQIDDEDFMKLFAVYAPSELYAEEVITPIFREGLKRIIKRVPGDYYITFKDDLLTIARNSGKGSFGIHYPTDLLENDCEILIRFFKELYANFILIDDLILDKNV